MPSVHEQSDDAASAMRATSVRYRVLFVTFLTSVLLYLDRFCMNFAQRYVQEDLGLTDAQVDRSVAVFFLAYGLAQVPMGGLTDRFGSRAMLAIYVLAWSFFTAAMGWVGGFVSLLAVRLAAGMSQAGAYPTGARVVGQWAPLAQRGVANSIIALGGRVGGAMAPPLTAALVVAFVPLSVSPLLTPADLLDAYKLSVQLAAEPAAGAELSQLTAEQNAAAALSRLVLGQIESQGVDGARARTVISELAARSQPRTVDMAEAAQSLPLPPVDGAERDILIAALNRVIEQGVPATTEQFTLVKLEREAKPLLARRDTLSGPERQRLTRLVLEAVFPTGIRKLYVHGWRPVMLWYGLAGILVAGWFYWQVRDRSAQHPRVNAAELELIGVAGPRSAAPATAQRVPLRAIMASPSLWLLSLTAFGTNVGWFFLVSHLDRFLYTVHGVPYVERGMMQSVPLFVGWAGMLLGGWWTDRLTRRRGIRMGRAAPIAISRFVAMAAFVLMLLHPSPWVCIALMAAVGFGTDLGSPAIWSVCQDVGGRSVAAVLGWGNMWGNLGAAAAPIFLGWVARQWDWDSVFLVCAGAFLVAGVAALFVDATRPIEAETRGLTEPGSRLE